MNFLGHFYLSRHDPDLIVGNYIADYVKGKKYLDYPDGIRDGIIMHRHIDFFTDRHPMVRQGRSRLFHKYRHFSGVIIDMYYDHFLASMWERYAGEPLHEFSQVIYKTIENSWDVLPMKSQYLFSYMSQHDWLVRYASMQGLGRSLDGMSKRINNNSRLDQAIHDLYEHYDLFREEFKNFIEGAKAQFPAI